MKPFYLLSVLPSRLGAGLFSLLVLAGCSPVGLVVGTGATVAIAASEERGVSGAAADTGIRFEINKLWLDQDFELYRRVGLQVHEGRVLLSGTVPTIEMSDEAARLAWQPRRVREVINETKVDASGGLISAARDKWISTEVRTRLMFERDIDAINYSTRTVDGSVYLLGLARDEAELDRVFAVIRTTPNVRSVVSYVLVRDDPRRTS